MYSRIDYTLSSNPFVHDGLISLVFRSDSVKGAWEIPEVRSDYGYASVVVRRNGKSLTCLGRTRLTGR